MFDLTSNQTPAVNLPARIQQACDPVLGPIYRPLVWLMLAFMVAFTGARAYELSTAWEEWNVADWLISYAAGFVRRGLGGELILRGAAASGIPPNRVVFGVVSGLFVALCALLAYLLRGRRITFWYLVLCVSPGCLLFTFNDPFTVGRKELLLYVLFAGWIVVWMNREAPPGLRSHVAFSVAAVLITLMHELVVFYAGYFVAAAFVAARRHTMGGAWRSSGLIPAASMAAGLGIAGLSGALNDPALCLRLTAIGAPESVCRGVLTFDLVTTAGAIERFVDAFETPTLLGLIGAFPIVLVPLSLFLAANASDRAEARLVAAVTGALMVASLPLFVLGRDWGRWVSIHIMLSTILCAMFLPPTASPPARSPRIVRLPLIAVGLCLIASMFMWRLKHCCEYEYFDPMSPLERIREARASLQD